MKRLLVLGCLLLCLAVPAHGINIGGGICVGPNCGGGAGGGSGNVTGPASSTANHIATFTDTTGKAIKDGGAAGSGTVTNTAGNLTASNAVVGNGTNDLKVLGGPPALGAGTTVAGHVATYADTGGQQLADGGTLLTPAQVCLVSGGAACNLTGNLQFGPIVGNSTSYVLSAALPNLEPTNAVYPIIENTQSLTGWTPLYWCGGANESGAGCPTAPTPTGTSHTNTIVDSITSTSGVFVGDIVTGTTGQPGTTTYVINVNSGCPGTCTSPYVVLSQAWGSSTTQTYTFTHPQILDNVWFNCFNCNDAGGAPTNGALPMMKFQTEGSYLDSGGGAIPLNLNSEFNIDYKAPGATSYRPLQFQVVYPLIPTAGTPSTTFTLNSSLADYLRGAPAFQLQEVPGPVINMGLPFVSGPCGAYYRVGIFADNALNTYDTAFINVNHPLLSVASPPANGSYLGGVSEAVIDSDNTGASTASLSLQRLFGGLDAGIYSGTLGGSNNHTTALPHAYGRQINLTIDRDSRSVPGTPSQTVTDAHLLDLNGPLVGGNVVTSSLDYVTIESPQVVENASACGSPSTGWCVPTLYGIRIHDIESSDAGLGNTTEAVMHIDAQNAASPSATKGNVEWGGGHWNDGHLVIGPEHLWYSTGSASLRGKSSAPTSDTDGTSVGPPGLYTTHLLVEGASCVEPFQISPTVTTNSSAGNATLGSVTDVSGIVPGMSAWLPGLTTQTTVSSVTWAASGASTVTLASGTNVPGSSAVLPLSVGQPSNINLACTGSGVPFSFCTGSGTGTGNAASFYFPGTARTRWSLPKGSNAPFVHSQCASASTANHWQGEVAWDKGATGTASAGNAMQFAFALPSDYTTGSMIVTIYYHLIPNLSGTAAAADLSATHTSEWNFRGGCVEGPMSGNQTVIATAPGGTPAVTTVYSVANSTSIDNSCAGSLMEHIALQRLSQDTSNDTNTGGIGVETVDISYAHSSP